MAIKDYTLKDISGFGQYGKTITYSGLAISDQGAPLEAFGYADRSVQVDGVFGSGGSVMIEGSNNGSTYYPLTDPQGNNLEITSGKIEQISEAVVYLRPRVTSGDGSTSINVTILMRKGNH